MADSNSPSLFERKLDPLIQAGVTLLLSCVVMLITYGGVSQSEDGQMDKIWLVSSSFVLIYVIFNSILSYGTDQVNRYVPRSVIGFVLLIVLSSVVAQMLSGIAIDDAGTYKWLFVVFTMCYMVFLVIVRMMRKIIDLAQEQDKKLRNEI